MSVDQLVQSAPIHDAGNQTSDPIACAVQTAWANAFGTKGKDPARTVLQMGVGAGRVSRLMAEIEAATGVVLPITAIFGAGTCAELTRIVRTGQVPEQAALVLLKPGDDSVPLFVVPGIGATVFELCDMASRIECPGPVFACQPRGPDGTEPIPLVADQARYLAEAITAHAGHRAVNLLGYSYGGVVTIEIARYLTVHGKPLGMVGLLDTGLPESAWPAHVRMGFLARRFGTHLAHMRRQGAKNALRYGIDHMAPLLSRLRRLVVGTDARAVEGSPYRISGLPPALETVRNNNIAAFYAYKPSFYDGEVTIFLSADGDPMMCRPMQIWPRYIKTIVTRDAGGAHETMMRGRHAITLAASVSEALRVPRNTTG